MGFLNETGVNLRAIWTNLSFAARCSATLAIVAVLATAGWWAQRTPETTHIVLFPEQPLAPSELVAMEAAFGRARLNGARLVDGHFEVPADRKDDYVRALLDHQALPATPASFSERLIAQDNLFTSPRQREALMKLAKEREIALMVRQIAGIAEATVHYEDVEGDGFPRRKSRRATVAVRSRATQSLAPQLIHAIRTTVANSLGIDPAGHIAVLDLNEGIAYTDSSASSRSAADSRMPPETPRVAPSPRQSPPARDGDRSTEPTGPIKLATFDSPDASSNSPPHFAVPRKVRPSGELAGEPSTEPSTKRPDKPVAESRDEPTVESHAVPADEPHDRSHDRSHDSSRRSSTESTRHSTSRTHGSTHLRTQGTAHDETRGGTRDNTSDEKSEAETAEPRLLPMSILRMVRPANHLSADDARRAIDVRVRQTANEKPGAERLDESTSERSVEPLVESERDAVGATDGFVPAKSSRPARETSPRVTNRDDATDWSVWLRDHAATVGGLAGGFGVLGWLMRALLSATWAPHVESTRVVARTAPVGHSESRGEAHPQLACDPLSPPPSSAPPDARRELSDRVRDDATTAAAKLRQWLGHAA